MQFATRKVQDVLVIELSGRLDSHTAGDVGDRIDAIGTGAETRCVLNLGGLDYVSSAGLRVILRLSRLLKSHGGELKISNARDMVAAVLETAGFDSLLRMHATEQEAVDAFAAA
ncbi:STAS domain-containing protein [Falsiroseomonas oryzae]|uniref:STAS domain-containing protein n=1 Tax=Falsiroseomonas oryzae TaxID=2766473 RepID=UPI0022EB9B7E|nr:STAS domain-containing protein [Roseomonas sp. MO-31]